jgi:hypothetical protein
MPPYRLARATLEGRANPDVFPSLSPRHTFDNAIETPDLLVGELRRFFGSVS